MKADRAIMRTSRRKRYFTAKRMSGWIWGIFRAGIILGIAYVILYPLLVKLSVSLMGDGDMYDMTVKWLPKKPTLSNFKEVLWLVDYESYLLTTLAVSAGATFIQVASSTLAAYGLARFSFRGRTLVFLLVILTLVLPQQTYMTTTYMQYRYCI